MVFDFKMADPTRKRRSDKRSSDEKFDESLKHCELLASSYKPKQKRKPVTFNFFRDPVTGNRTTHCTYRPTPRTSTSTTTSTTPAESDQVTLQDICNIVDHDSNPEDDSSDVTKKDSNLNDALNKCHEILGSYAEPPKRTWDSRMTAVSESWESCRKDLMEAMLSQQGKSCITSCGNCCNPDASVRCIECRKVLCTSCDQNVHSILPFHDREAFIEGFFQPIPPTSIVDANGSLTTVGRCLPLNTFHHCKSCLGAFSYIPVSGRLIVVTQKGRFDLDRCNIYCKNCKITMPSWTMQDIVQAGFWPGTSSDLGYIFDQKLFQLWDAIQKRMPGTSENSFIRALEDFSQIKGRCAVINSTAFARSFKEWKFCQHELCLLSCEDWMKCPTCSMNQHSCHVDGNMKLYRYKSSGMERRSSYYKDLFVADKNDVDMHLKKIYSKQAKFKENDNRCGDSHWKAANNTGKKKSKQDETGLEIAGCRHGLALWSVNMYQGELYGYAHYIQMYKMVPAGVRFFWEDIVCKYWKWAEKLGLPDGMNPALSVMHAKAHSWNCQVIWGGRWQDGSACTTGEEVEQINSYLSRCGNTTKYMLPENRDEMLTEHALGWNKRKIIGMVASLCQRYSRVSTFMQPKT